MDSKLQAIQLMSQAMFKILPSEGQAQIIQAILDKSIKRIWIGTPTQYGKSLNIALGSILSLVNHNQAEKIPIIAPTREQCKIIMNYIISHVLDQSYFYQGLLEVERLRRLQTEFSKDRLAWTHGSEVRTISADATANASDINKGGQSLMGFGGSIVIVDEASMIPDLIMGKILRMLGANPESKLILIGNPFNLNYFYQAYLSDNFYKIKIDWKQAVNEGRFTQSFITEMKETLSPEMFKILYDVEFIIGTLDSYITGNDIDLGTQALRANIVSEPFKQWQEAEAIKVGHDVARFGNDESVIIVRKGFKLLRVIREKQRDLMSQVGLLTKLQEEFHFKWENVNIDDIGVGGGVTDRLKELGYSVNGVSVEQGANAEGIYYDLKTELWAKVKNEIKSGRLELNHKELIGQLVIPRYEYRNRASGAVLKLESKENLKKRGFHSPDIADALVLSYYEKRGYFVSSLSYF